MDTEEFDGFPDEMFAFGRGPERLAALLQRGELRRVRELLVNMGTFDRQEAENCLHAGLRCPDALYAQLLAHCPRGLEFVACEKPDTPPGAPWREASVYGTLPTVAAAMGETEKLRLLLEHGMDCNAASFAAFQAVQTGSPRVQFFEFDSGFAGFETEQRLHWRQRLKGGCADAAVYLTGTQEWLEGESGCLINCLTPLAAAILFGHADCVRLLLARPGIRIWESSAVGAAALLAARGTAAQRRCARLAFGLPEGADIAAALCADVRLPLETAAVFGTPEDLRRWLKATGAGIDEARILLENEKIWHEAGLNEGASKKLLSVYAAYPALLREPEARDRLLITGVEGLFYPWTESARRLMKALGQAPEVQTYGAQLLKLWRRAAGPVRDISAGMGALGRGQSGPWLKQTLEVLAEDGELTAAAETAVGCWPELDLYALLRKVRFYRCTDRGVSALAADILQTGSLRLLRFALRQGVLAGEDRAALLRYVTDGAASAPIRAAVLTMPARDPTVQPLREDICRQYWTGLDEAGREALRQEREALLTQPAPEEHRRAVLERCRDDSSASQYDFTQPVRTTPDGTIQCPSYLSAICCCSGDPALLRLARSLDYTRRETAWDWFVDAPYNANLDDFAGVHTVLNGTALSLAAAAGQTALVAALLAEGADPDENDRTERSMANYYWQREDLVVTPLALALAMGREETAAALIAAGADRTLAEGICARLLEQRAKSGDEEVTWDDFDVV